MPLTLVKISCISILPIFLIKAKLIPKRFRLILLMFICGIVALFIKVDHISANEMGLRFDNIQALVPVYFFATFFAILFIIFLSRVRKTKHAHEWQSDPHFLFLFIPISVAQQFLFQGYILSRMSSLFPIAVAIMCTAFLFGYMHSIYPKPCFSFVFGTVAGLFFAMIYTLYPNLILISISHALLNCTAVYVGFFTFTTEHGTPAKTSLTW